jgi:DNA-binding NtrC family response regulator
MFEAADEGTLFLDEIEELSPAGQAKLLRVLQEREVQRVGSAKTKQVNVRVIAASNRDLRKLVQEKKFREDLFYRLAMVEVRVPSLAERLEDLELLLTHFLQQYSQRFGKQMPVVSRSARAALFRYDWPGNVRELENVVGNAVMTAEGPVVDVEHLTPEIVGFQPSSQGDTKSVFTADNTLKLAEIENRYIEYVLQLESGNIGRAALRLGIPRSTLYTRVKLMKTSKSAPEL